MPVRNRQIDSVTTPVAVASRKDPSAVIPMVTSKMRYRPKRSDRLPISMEPTA